MTVDGRGGRGTGDSPRVLALPPAVPERSIPTLEDVREYFDPDGIWVLGPDRNPQAVARARHVFEEPIVHAPLGDQGSVQRHTLGNLAVVTVQRGAVLDQTGTEDALTAARATDRPTVLVCDDVTTTIRPTELETRLEFATELASLGFDSDSGSGEGGHEPPLTVLTGGLPATYDETWILERSGAVCRTVSGERRNGREDSAGVRTRDGDGDEDENRETVAIRVHGLGSVDGYNNAPSVSCLTFSSGHGTDTPIDIDVETLDTDAFGLEAVTGIGPKTTRRLESAGITTRADLLETPLETLREYPGIGSTSATRMHAHAEVLETGEPRRLTDESLPGQGGRPPLCLDIETDGLSPRIIWQIGVYDPVTDDHHAFVERSDPEDPQPVLESFCDWLFGVHPDRALCTWNGWRFDYRHLGSFIGRYVPHYSETWDAIPQFDLYGWAITEGNALLPARTNKLDDVSSALGYESTDTGLDGAETAAAYQRFVRTGDELAWNRHEAYCEDDCRALWFVYEQLRDAPSVKTDRSRLETADDGNYKRSQQTGLGDF